MRSQDRALHYIVHRAVKIVDQKIKKLNAFFLKCKNVLRLNVRNNYIGNEITKNIVSR